MRDQNVSAAERTEVLALLNRAVDEGHLDPGLYHGRVAAIGTATYTSQLIAPLGDLPPEYAWLPAAAVAPTAPGRSAGRAALVLGLLSVPTAFCVLGGVLGVVAIVLSLRGDRPAGMSAALFGRVFGIVGVILAIGALIALTFTLGRPLDA
jgi:hypothetical protein